VEINVLKKEGLEEENRRLRRRLADTQETQEVLQVKERIRLEKLVEDLSRESEEKEKLIRKTTLYGLSSW
jgi:hypothetical protein